MNADAVKEAAKREIIYTSKCGMYRVILQDGFYYPQEREVYVSGFGRLFNERTVQLFQQGPNIVMDHGWSQNNFHLGYEQFSTRSKGYRKYKSEKTAIKFVNQCSENLNANMCAYGIDINAY